MSCHLFRTAGEDGSLVLVRCGYDVPLGGFYMLVSPAADEYDYLFNNLDLEESHPTDFNVFVGFLTKMGLQLPAEMIADVISDQANQIVNKRVIHTVTDGVYSKTVELPGMRSERFALLPEWPDDL